MTKQMRDEVRSEWRQLGFYFAYDEAARRWSIVGSPRGLRRFCEILRDYANDPRHAALSEHEHYGPYQDLKLVTWHVPEIRHDGIYGRLSDFARLATIVEDALRTGAAVTPIRLSFVGFEGGAGDELDVHVASADFTPDDEDAAITS